MFQKFGRYILLDKIATGGMAEIWLARQSGIKGFEKLVVVKKILPHFNTNEKFTTMFINEAKIASKLNHPNIVQIYDLGKENNIFYIVMEYVPGYDLLTVIQQSIKAKNRLPLAYAVKIISQAANALYYANSFRDIDTKKLNIVHRDISPQNILVSYDGITKVVDFGIAKATSTETMTKTGVLKGKYPYMSPEQILGKKLDGRSDIFSLAIVLYEITVGKRLFKADSELMTLRKITEDKIYSPIEVHPKFPVKLNDIIMKALARNRSERYSSARDFALDLDNFLLVSQKNVTTSDISKWLKEIFREDIINRILNNKRLFNEADIFLEKLEIEKEKTEQNTEDENIYNKNNINEFEFDKNISTNDLKLGFDFGKQNKGLSDLDSGSTAKDSKNENNKRILYMKAVKIFIMLLFIYIIFFGGLLFYNIYSSNKTLEKDLTASAVSSYPGKELNRRIEVFCNRNYVQCDVESIRIIELKNELKLNIKYKIKRDLFYLIPFELDYDKSLKRNIE